MTIREVRIRPQTLDKIIWKHHITEAEIRQVFRNRHQIRFIERGKVENEHLYAVLGQTDSGRYVTVFFIHKQNRDALLVTARDMSAQERKRYEKK